MLVQSHPKGHLLLPELHTHPCGEIHLQVLLLLVVVWPVGQLPTIGVSAQKEEGKRIVHACLHPASFSYPTLSHLPFGSWGPRILYRDDI